MAKCFFVAGNPIASSYSPIIFNAFASHMNYDFFYTRALCHNEKDISLLLENGFSGCNVTAPLKEKVLQLPFAKTLLAEKIRAANVIFSDVCGFVLDNTDVYAVNKVLQNINMSNHANIVILGIGGAGRAALISALEFNLPIVICNRTFEKAKYWANLFGCQALPWDKISNAISSTSIIINAQYDVSTLMKNISIEQIFIDANYHQNNLKRYCLERNIRYVDGFQWLVWQAVSGFSLLTGKIVDSGILFDAIEQKINVNKTRLLVLIGMMKSGKTTVGQILADKLKVDFVDLDELISIRVGKSIEDIFNSDGEEFFRKIEESIFAELIKSNGNKVLSLGGGGVLSSNNRKLLKEVCYTVWLFAPPNELYCRYDNTIRPLLTNDVEQTLRLLHLRRLPFYCECADLLVPSYAGSPNSIAQSILDEINHLQKMND